ncbi:MAG: precorrin-6Y C5,15-methyltransferase (decarboxylating) subunit CbiT [Selenomonadaceae bacterium]|nr:precorrin-6Y C5,15-methyltransferase (decarboxylating) subunit CbiT [Selenomonadaceae bacterium]
MLGIDDDEFIRGKIPMTKREIRILTLANANIGEKDIVVDIGAGTGSISIEAALLAKGGHVYALERKLEGVNLIEKNAEKFSVKNITIINAEAPDGLSKIPKVDVAIIGGSGGFLEEILTTVDKKIDAGGRIVFNCITIQTLAKALTWLKTHKEYKYEIVQVQISRFKNLGSYDMAEALNPVHILTAVKMQRFHAPNVINFFAKFERKIEFEL